MSNMTRVALSALKASVQWKGAWTQHTWRTRTKKKNKKRKQKPTGGDRGNVLIQTQSGTFTVLSIQHMGGEERAPMFVWFFLCSGRVLMHGGNTSTEHSWGEGSKVMTKSYKNRKKNISHNQTLQPVISTQIDRDTYKERRRHSRCVKKFNPSILLLLLLFF